MPLASPRSGAATLLCSRMLPDRLREPRRGAATARGPLDDPELARFIAESASHEMVVMVGLARRTAEGVSNTELVIHRGKLLGPTTRSC